MAIETPVRTSILLVGDVPHIAGTMVLEQCGRDLSDVTVVYVDTEVFGKIVDHLDDHPSDPRLEGLHGGEEAAQSDWDLSCDQWVEKNLGATRSGVIALVFSPSAHSRLSDPAQYPIRTPASSRRLGINFPDATYWIGDSEGAYEI